MSNDKVGAPDASAIPGISRACSEERDRRAAVERGPRAFDARRFIERPEFMENPARSLKQLTSRREVSNGLS